MMNLFVENSVEILDGSVLKNNQLLYHDKVEDVDIFLKNAFKRRAISYKKFFKMDTLCKLGFLSSEILLEDVDLNEFKPEEIAIVCANRSSSIHTDLRYQQTTSTIPSPAVFVYTLPNIVIGEICIRNDIKGESIFLVQETFDTDFFIDYIQILFETTNTKLAIIGWLELDGNDDYHSKMWLVSSSEKGKLFNDKLITLK